MSRYDRPDNTVSFFVHGRGVKKFPHLLESAIIIFWAYSWIQSGLIFARYFAKQSDMVFFDDLRALIYVFSRLVCVKEGKKESHSRFVHMQEKRKFIPFSSSLLPSFASNRLQRSLTDFVQCTIGASQAIGSHVPLRMEFGCLSIERPRVKPRQRSSGL